jgi:DNA-binding LacI/PurR family transcriptional regulator
MKVTRKDIAREVGVSVSTVGMILDGYGARYSAETRKKVLKAAEKLDYRPNLVGRSLRTGKSFLLGILLFDGNARWYSELLRGISRALAGGEYSPVVFSHGGTEEEAEALRRCLDRQVDGLLVNTAVNPDGSVDTQRYRDLRRQGLALVELFGHFLRRVPSVNVDNAGEARAAVEHLLAKGHRRIAMLTHEHYRLSKGKKSGKHFDAWEQYQGYAAALRDAGLQPQVFTHPLRSQFEATDDFFEGGVQALDQCRAAKRRPTAVVCYNDFQAFGLIRAARVDGLAIPGELAVVGNGDLDLSRITSPALTSLRLPAVEVGEKAAGLLLDLIEGRPVEDTVVTPHLVERESSG